MKKHASHIKKDTFWEKYLNNEIKGFPIRSLRTQSNQRKFIVSHSEVNNGAKHEDFGKCQPPSHGQLIKNKS